MRQQKVSEIISMNPFENSDLTTKVFECLLNTEGESTIRGCLSVSKGLYSIFHSRNAQWWRFVATHLDQLHGYVLCDGDKTVGMSWWVNKLLVIFGSNIQEVRLTCCHRCNQEILKKMHEVHFALYELREISNVVLHDTPGVGDKSTDMILAKRLKNHTLKISPGLLLRNNPPNEWLDSQWNTKSFLTEFRSYVLGFAHSCCEENHSYMEDTAGALYKMMPRYLPENIKEEFEEDHFLALLLVLLIKGGRDTIAVKFAFFIDRSKLIPIWFEKIATNSFWKNRYVNYLVHNQEDMKHWVNVTRAWAVTVPLFQSQTICNKCNRSNDASHAASHLNKVSACLYCVFRYTKFFDIQELDQCLKRFVQCSEPGAQSTQILSTWSKLASFQEDFPLHSSSPFICEVLRGPQDKFLMWEEIASRLKLSKHPWEAKTAPTKELRCFVNGRSNPCQMLARLQKIGMDIAELLQQEESDPTDEQSSEED